MTLMYIFICSRLRWSLLLTTAVLTLQTFAQKNKSDDTQAVPSDLRRVVSEALALERKYLQGARDM